MAEMINKWDVVDKLIHLENEYNFHKWDAQTLYRKLCEVEVEIGKTSGVGWIPVTERLPETAGKYLVWGKDVHGIGLHDAKYYLPPCPPDGLGGWCGKLNVTHWMPLPQPPKKLDPAEGR